MKQFFTYAHADVFGFTASAICAVHCAALPLVFTMGMLGGLEWLASPWIEITFIFLSIGIATFALGRNFRKHKHIRRAVQVVALGFALIIGSRFMHGDMHHILTAAGGLIVAAGHVLNWQLARKSECCQTH